jgi:hypothetical protein
LWMYSANFWARKPPREASNRWIDCSRKQEHWPAWWCTSVIPLLRRLRQEDYEFKTSLGCAQKSLCIIFLHCVVQCPVPSELWKTVMRM